MITTYLLIGILVFKILNRYGYAENINIIFIWPYIVVLSIIYGFIALYDELFNIRGKTK